MNQNETPKSFFMIDANTTLMFKIAALVLAMGILIGKLNAIDERMARMERFLDSNISLKTK